MTGDRAGELYWADTVGAALDRNGYPAAQLSARLISNGYSGYLTVRLDGISSRQARRVLRSSGLPSPRAFVSAGRCLKTLDAARVAPVSLERAALETGWSEYSSFQRSSRTIFGMSPRCLARLSHRQALRSLVSRAERPPEEPSLR